MENPTGSKRRKTESVLVGDSCILHDDVLIEILSRLPTKSLCRFRSVSRAWSNCISDVFSKRRTPLPMSGFLIYPDIDFRAGIFVPISPNLHRFQENFGSALKEFFVPRTFAVDSCNGLLLLTNQNGCALMYYVFNPATGEFVGLPLPPYRTSEAGDLEHCYLAFDPRKSPHYKVVRFYSTLIDRCIAVDIYSSITEEWTEFGDFYSLCLSQLDQAVVFHESALHFLMENGYLLQFHIEEIKFHLIKLPENEMASSSECIGESRGHLCYAIKFKHVPELRIYMLNEGSSKDWQLIHKMDTKFLEDHSLTYEPIDDLPPLHFQIISFHQESEVIYLWMPGKILSYDPSSRKLDVISVDNKLDVVRIFPGCTDKFDHRMIFSVIPCLESLDPPGGKFINPLAL